MALGTVGLRSPRMPTADPQPSPKLPEINLMSDSSTQTDIEVSTPPRILSESASLDVDVATPLRILSDTTSLASSQGDDHTGKSWASVVNDPWHPLILCLDGGGIRGYSSLLILKKLMVEIARWERIFEAMERPTSQRRTFDENELLPCHYFDFMYGTSTGGLIATMLGRLRMNVSVCLDMYKIVGNELFGKRRSSIPLATKYHHEPLEKAVRKIIMEHCPITSHRRGSDGEHINCDGLDWHPWHIDDEGNEPDELEQWHKDTDNRLCQSICLTATHNKRATEAYLLRTYNHVYSIMTPEFVTEYNTGAEKLRIWQVTRATSAAPFYFQSLIADVANETKEFKDGGIRENNPSGAAWSEFISLYGAHVEPALLLSVGTGRPNRERDGFAETWPGPVGHWSLMRKFAETFAVVNHMLVKYTDGELKHDMLVNQAQGMHGWYKRLNVDTGLEDMKLDSWEPSEEIDDKGVTRHVPGGKTLATIKDVTEKYLARTKEIRELKEYAPPKTMISQTAEKLVRHRRAREKTKDVSDFDRRRWESLLGQHL